MVYCNSHWNTALFSLLSFPAGFPFSRLAVLTFLILGVTTRSICNHNSCQLDGTLKMPTSQPIAFDV